MGSGQLLNAPAGVTAVRRCVFVADMAQGVSCSQCQEGAGLTDGEHYIIAAAESN